jgi:hypothetical protein
MGLSVIFGQVHLYLGHIITVRFLLSQIRVGPPILTTASKVDRVRNLAPPQCYPAGCRDNKNPCDRRVPLSSGDGLSEILSVRDLSSLLQYLQIDGG